MVLAVEKPSFLVYQLLEPHFRQLFRVVKVSKICRETFLIFIFSSWSGRNYPVVRYVRLCCKARNRLCAPYVVTMDWLQEYFNFRVNNIVGTGTCSSRDRNLYFKKKLPVPVIYQFRFIFQTFNCEKSLKTDKS